MKENDLKNQFDKILQEHKQKNFIPKLKVDKTQHQINPTRSSEFDIIRQLANTVTGCPAYEEKKRDLNQTHKELVGGLISSILESYPEEHREKILEKYLETLN